MFDLLIKNGTVVDGSGSKALHTDLAVKDGRIVELGLIESQNAKKCIDATNCLVSPGFVDIHTHSDMSVQVDSRSESQIRQGVTTELIGLCGFSNAPCSDATRSEIIHNFDGSTGAWYSFSEYLEALDQCKPSTNLACLAGHGTLRTMVMPPFSRASTASVEDIEAMQKLLERCLEQGAFGMSTGLEYFPGKAASLYELESLCTILSRFDALHASHVRNRDLHALHAYTEVLEIARNTQSRLQISHINPKYARPPNTMKHALQIINWMRDEGVCVGIDIIPSIWNHASVTALLPLWALDLPLDERIALLQDPLRNPTLRFNHAPFMQLHVREQWDKIRILKAKATQRHLGKTVAAIAKEYGCDGWEVLFSLLIEEGEAMNGLKFAGECFSPEDMLEALQDPFCSVVSDSAATAIDGPTQHTSISPNSFEWSTSFLQNFVFKQKALSLEEGIRRLTSLPASQIQLKERGLLAKGYYADLVIMNLETLHTDATFENPAVYPKGIEMVIVNGEIALDKDIRSAKHSGKVLRAT